MSGPHPRIVIATASDGYRFAVRLWEPPSRAVGRIVLLHGIISHGGWYLDSCRHLAAAGLEVHFLDRRGSGLNDATRGDVPGHERWLADVEDYIEALTPGPPVLLFGVSWGAKLAVAIARHRPDLVAGLALLSPGLYARQGPGSVARAALSVARRIGLGGMRVAIPLQDPALFTDTPSWRAFIRDDPLTLRRATVRLALADGALSCYATADPAAIAVPTLCVLAGGDRIVDNARVRAFVKRLGAPAEVVEYPGAAHTLEFEPVAPRYFASLADWASGLAGGRGSG